MQRRSLLILPLLAACTSVDVDRTTTIVGVVETVDPQSREILLRGQGGAQTGKLVTLIAGRGVQRLNQIKAGDRVTVRYYQALAARAVRPGAPGGQPFAGVAIAREAERPGGEVTRVRAGRVTITDVDRLGGTVSFVGPGNMTRTVTAESLETRTFILGLRVGEQVDMVYEEALAISIEPMS
ncbi:hypothetical protein [Neoroseomonas lacus]|uniref:DUF5666 domain-containing protein n=1 Tax=Neoroseomonas lacus TaxID=287609 RepID=A0A917P0Z8_9PROT|nr:hypothetical protein [Neoroseomonas lacus]GGJ43489.1 hypothetical protein GCM10011320_58760 [Neoroseomonas lacus]